MQNPYLQALQGYQNVSQSLGNASRLYREAEMIFNSGASLAVKLDYLLKQEEARKQEAYQKSIQSIQNTVNTMINQKREQERFEQAKKMEEERLGLAKRRLALSEETTKSNLLTQALQRKKLATELSFLPTKYALEIGNQKLRAKSLQANIWATKVRTGVALKQMRMNAIKEAFNQAKEGVSKYKVSETGEITENPNYRQEYIQNVNNYLKAIGEKPLSIREYNLIAKNVGKEEPAENKLLKQPDITSYIIKPEPYKALSSKKPEEISKYNKTLSYIKSVTGVAGLPRPDIPKANDEIGKSLLYQTIKKIDNISNSAFKKTSNMDKGEYLKKVAETITTKPANEISPSDIEILEEAVKKGGAKRKDILELVSSSTNPMIRAIGDVYKNVVATKTAKIDRDGNIKSDIEDADSTYSYSLLADGNNWKLYRDIFKNNSLLSSVIESWFTGESKRGLIKKLIQYDKNNVKMFGRPLIAEAIKIIDSKGAGRFISGAYPLGFNIVGEETKVTPFDVFDIENPVTKAVFGDKNIETVRYFKDAIEKASSNTLFGYKLTKEGIKKDISKSSFLKKLYKEIDSKNIDKNIENLYDTYKALDITGQNQIEFNGQVLSKEDIEDWLVGFGILTSGMWEK